MEWIMELNDLAATFAVIIGAVVGVTIIGHFACYATIGIRCV